MKISVLFLVLIALPLSRPLSALSGPPVQPDRTWLPEKLVDGTAKDDSAPAPRPEKPDKTWVVPTKNAKPGKARTQIKPAHSDRTWLQKQSTETVKENEDTPRARPVEPDKTWMVPTDKVKTGKPGDQITPVPSDREWKTDTKPPAAKPAKSKKKKQPRQ